MIGAMVALVLMGAMVMLIVLSHNRLMQLRHQVKHAFEQVDAQLAQRHDLIARLIETAGVCLEEDEETRAAVIEARERAVSAHSRVARKLSDATAMQALVAAETALSDALQRLRAAHKRRPDLAEASLRQLFDELDSNEKALDMALRVYNEAVMTYNQRRERFPDRWVASWFQFGPAQPFELAAVGQATAQAS